MWATIPILIACHANGDCAPYIGQQMSFTQCLTTSQAMAADFQKNYPGFKVEKIMCAEPRRVQAILGRHQA